MEKMGLKNLWQKSLQTNQGQPLAINVLSVPTGTEKAVLGSKEEPKKSWRWTMLMRLAKTSAGFTTVCLILLAGWGIPKLLTTLDEIPPEIANTLNIISLYFGKMAETYVVFVLVGIAFGIGISFASAFAPFHTKNSGRE